jgi:hypothetical protein
MILCLVLSFFAFEAEPEPEYDFMLISEDGTVTYHNVGPSVTGSLSDPTNTNPTYVASQNGGPATLKMLRDIKTNYHVTLLGNINFDGQGHTFTYTGTDYAFWVANSNFDLNDTGYGVDKPEKEMKRAKFENLKFGIDYDINKDE